MKHSEQKVLILSVPPTPVIVSVALPNGQHSNVITLPPASGYHICEQVLLSMKR